VKQLNGTWGKGHGTREGLSYRQIVRWANRQVGRRQRMANSDWFSGGQRSCIAENFERKERFGELGYCPTEIWHK
jgi:hypothetical protein